ncbi:MAG: caspase family protein [Deltaproteobacteria bacterium]|nr:caspase family protein [Deltaproteobacteria bacterium]
MNTRAVILLVCVLAWPEGLSAKPIRAGVFVGSMEGTFGEDALFYANTDALKMYTAFSEFGGLDPSLRALIEDASIDSIRAQLGELSQRLSLLERHQEIESECLFYYSGHGGPDGLHVDGQVYPYRALYDDVSDLGCDLLIVILDACNSGKLLEVKGITFQEEEFRVKAYNSKRGEIFITSSAQSEYAQEKDEFRGSVFTFYLVNGVLGAADANRDGQVTLSEAYGFASRQTIRETFGTARGFQVPSYRYELEGSQDAVLTELRSIKERVEVPGAQAGVLTFMDTEKGLIWGDFEIDADQRTVLLPRGDYLVRLRERSGTLRVARVRLGPKQCEWTDFETISASDDPIKGRRIYHRWSLRVDGGVQWAPDTSLVQGVDAGGGLAVLVDNLGLPPIYGGLALSAWTGSQGDTVFGSQVQSDAYLLRLEGILGLGATYANLVELSGELRLGGGLACLERRFAAHDESAQGPFFQAAIQAQAVWWLTRDLGLLLPAVQLALLVHGADSGIQTRLALGASGGIQVRF